jgi:hypothetical protein
LTASLTKQGKLCSLRAPDFDLVLWVGPLRSMLVGLTGPLGRR